MKGRETSLNIDFSYDADNTYLVASALVPRVTLVLDVVEPPGKKSVKRELERLK